MRAEYAVPFVSFTLRPPRVIRTQLEIIGDEGVCDTNER